MLYKMQFGQSCLHSRVVYSVHDYAWYERWFRIIMAIDSVGRLSLQQRFSWLWKLLSDANVADAGKAEFKRQRDYNWGFLKKQHVAPVWIGEFGAYADRPWWRHEL